MPSADKHLKRAHMHLCAARKMANDVDTLTWSCVALFYAAHEVVHAVFDKEPGLPPECRHPLNHTGIDYAKPGTNTVIKRHFRPIVAAYLDLSIISHDVRYKGLVVPPCRQPEFELDFADVCRWATLRLTDAGRAGLPSWLTTL